MEKIAQFGARHIRDGDTILTHCNSEVALGCIIEAHRSGKEIEVFATEVRPRNQGHITIRTLNDAGIKTNFIVDSAVRSFINDVDLVIVGADAVTVNGAVVNKIGTSQVAHTAKEARVNMIVAAETYKFAPRTVIGELIQIEERAAGRGPAGRDRKDPAPCDRPQPGVRCHPRGIYRPDRDRSRGDPAADGVRHHPGIPRLGYRGVPEIPGAQPQPVRIRESKNLHPVPGLVF